VQHLDSFCEKYSYSIAKQVCNNTPYASAVNRISNNSPCEFLCQRESDKNLNVLTVKTINSGYVREARFHFFMSYVLRHTLLIYLSLQNLSVVHKNSFFLQLGCHHENRS
jgi:hypothetical protein